MSQKVDFATLKVFVHNLRKEMPGISDTSMVKYLAGQYKPKIATRTAQTYIKKMRDAGLFNSKKSKKKATSKIDLNKTITSFKHQVREFERALNEVRRAMSVNANLRPKVKVLVKEQEERNRLARSELNRTIESYGAWIHPRDPGGVFPLACGEAIRDLKHRIKEQLQVSSWDEITLSLAYDGAMWLRAQSNERYDGFIQLSETLSTAILATTLGFPEKEAATPENIVQN